MRRALIITLLGLMTTGCGSDTDKDDNNDTGNNIGSSEPGMTGGCELVEETPLALDGIAPDGSNVTDMVNTMTGAHAAPLTWADETTTQIVVEVSDASNARFLDYEVDPDGPHGSIEIACDDVLAVDASVTVTTSDGQINTSLSSTLTQSSGAYTPLLSIDLTDDAGTFSASDWSEEDHDSTWADLSASWNENGINGIIDGYGEDTYGDGDEGIVTVMRFDIASFSAEGF